jgi:Protein of unknown function (DUF3120)
LLSLPPQPPNIIDLTVIDRLPIDADVVINRPIAPTHIVTQVGIQPWLVLVVAVSLISVPVFVEAPLVRYFPWVSLALSLGWAGLSGWLCRSPKTQFWGELGVGFTWTWCCGAIFWGWLRWEPIWHLPIEALALPIAVWGLHRRWAGVGQWFYLGSLLGTGVTDIYFYLVDLMPAWRRLMRVELVATESMSAESMPVESLDVADVFAAALQQMNTAWGIGWAIGLLLLLLTIGIYSIKNKSLSGMAFGGAVLSTILVDGLFWIAAVFA